MKRVLVVEDDSFKCDKIVDLLVKFAPSALRTTAKNVATAVDAVRKAPFDLIILDMSLPSHPIVPGGGAAMPLLNGGLEVLFELDSLHRGDPCVILTQYPEVEICEALVPLQQVVASIHSNYEINVLTCLEYSDNNRWRADLESIIKKYANTNP